jgi:hypothetical protein
LEKVDDSDLVEAKIKFEEVLSFSKLGLNRDITGIDKRLATLDSMLRTLEGFLKILSLFLI